MNLKEINKMIAKLNPYSLKDRPMLRFYLKTRRELEKRTQLTNVTL